jgi:large subunit ribosomal protein L9
MKVILKEAVESLGGVGDEVVVAKGYARNYLLHQKKAVLANPTNRKLVEQERKELELKAMKDKEKAEEMAKQVEGTVCTIAAKVSEEDRLYGSVSVRDIEEKLREQGVEVDRKTILLTEPIKSLGSYQVPIQLYPEVRPEITVEVVPES